MTGIDPSALATGVDFLRQVEGAEKLFLKGRQGRGEDLESAVRIFMEFLKGFESFVTEVGNLFPVQFVGHPYGEVVCKQGNVPISSK